MLKAYYFMWRREGMTRDEFVEYYEKSHVDLIVDNLPKASDFRRNYPAWHRSDTTHQGSSPFDVLTAITYESRAAFEAAMHVYHSPPFNDTVTEDEVRFLNRSRVRFVPVDEVIDQLPDEQWQPAPAVPEGAKLVRLARRPAALDTAEFRTTYEVSETPAIRSEIRGCVDYRRNYIRGSDSFSFITPELQAELDDNGLLNCDLLEEFCFASAADAEAAARALDATPVHSALAGMHRTPAIFFDQFLRTA